MPTWPKEELEEAFRNYYLTGLVNEDWTAWSHLFTDDAVYKDHFWGVFHGPAEIEQFLETTMGGSPMVYAALQWYVINDDGRILYQVSNRADHPGEGTGFSEFPSLQNITYAGNGKFSSEEDWWVLNDMKLFVKNYNAALAESDDPDWSNKLSRRDFGDWVDWARPADPNHVAKPSWSKHDFKRVLYLRDIDFGERQERA